MRGTCSVLALSLFLVKSEKTFGWTNPQLLWDEKAQGFPGYVDLAPLRRNFARIASMGNAAYVAAVVKADACGLGAIRVARSLVDAGCRQFFVAHATEAVALWPHLLSDAQLFVLRKLLPGAEAVCASAQVTPVINSLTQLYRWRTQARTEGVTLLFYNWIRVQGSVLRPPSALRCVWKQRNHRNSTFSTS